MPCSAIQQMKENESQVVPPVIRDMHLNSGQMHLFGCNDDVSSVT